MTEIASRPDGLGVHTSCLPLRLEGVCFDAGGERLLQTIDLTISGGNRTVILGPNGAGKSLLLRLCHGLLRPSIGRIIWGGFGEDPETARVRQGMVFQRPVLLRRSVVGNIAFALAARKVPAGERARRIEEALAVADLGFAADRPARVLSGGEQQRLALAIAWSLSPELLFLDEPTATLDPSSTAAIEAMAARLHDAGVKIVAVTHDIPQARRLADEIVVMSDGRLIEIGPAKEILEAPVETETRDYLEGKLR